MPEEGLSLEGLWKRMVSIEKRISVLEYKVDKILKYLESIEQLRKKSQILQAFLGEIEEARLNNKVVVREGVILVREDLIEGLNEKKAEEELHCYIIHDMVEGERYVGFMPKVALEGEVTEEKVKYKLKNWFMKYGKDLVKRFV